MMFFIIIFALIATQPNYLFSMNNDLHQKPFKNREPIEYSKKIISAAFSPKNYPCRTWTENYSFINLHNRLENHPDLAHSYINKKNNSLITATVITAYVPENVRNNIVNYLLENNPQAHTEFLNMPIAHALSHYAGAEALSSNSLTKQPITTFFMLSSDQKKMLNKLYFHFSTEKNNISINVSVDEANLITELPKKIKQEFRNDEEFFTAIIYPSESDKAIRLTAAVLKGIIMGGGLTVANQLAYNYSKTLIMQEKLNKGILSVVQTIITRGLLELLFTITTKDPQRIASNLIWNTYSGNKNYELLFAKTYAFTKKAKSDASRRAIKSGINEAHNQAKKIIHLTNQSSYEKDVINQSIKHLPYSLSTTALLSGAYSLMSYNNPIDTISISKM